MTDITSLQQQTASAQEQLQNASNAVEAAQTHLNTLISAGATPQEIALAQSQVQSATNSQTFASQQYSGLQTELDDATQTLPGVTISAPLAPENADPPQVIDPYNGELTANYFTPSGSQLLQEASVKVASLGLVGSVASVAVGFPILSLNGSAYAFDSASGSVFYDMGIVTPDANTLPANTLPTSPDDQTQSLKVTITQQPSLSGDAAGNSVVLDVMPSITETRAANYRSFTPIQHPGEILKYDNTSSREWGISARLVSRTVDEADTNLRYINLIRSWPLPFYGTGTGSSDTTTSQYLGAPPPILTLTAYGTQMIGPVKCVLLNYNWTWPNDIDWITTSTGVPFPVIIEITLSLKESFSPAEYSAFDLLQYRNGNLPAAYGGASASQFSALGKSSSTTAQLNPGAVDISNAPTASIPALLGANRSAQSMIQSASAGVGATPTTNQVQGASLIQKSAGFTGSSGNFGSGGVTGSW